MANRDRKIIDKVFILLGSAAVAVLLVIGGIAWWGYSFATHNVRTELSAQKIYFPPKGSASFSPQEFPDIQKYAGKQVIDGPTAKAYANSFIARHLQKVAGGKTYAEVSALSMASPANQQLQQQKQTLFQGETLRGLLLGDGYAYWTFGQLAQYAAVTAFAGAIIMAILVFLGIRHFRRVR